MKKSEKGFTIVELLIAVAITAMVGSTAAMTVFQVLRNSEGNNNRMTAMRQVQNAGYWISQDAQMAQNVLTDNLTPPDFLVLNWTVWEYGSLKSTYHSVTYFFESQTDGIGKLKRRHWSSDGENNQTPIAEYIYYNPDDPEKTSKASYQSAVFTLQLTALLPGTTETREYKINRRPTY